MKVVLRKVNIFHNAYLCVCVSRLSKESILSCLVTEWRGSMKGEIYENICKINIFHIGCFMLVYPQSVQIHSLRLLKKVSPSVVVLGMR